MPSKLIERWVTLALAKFKNVPSLAKAETGPQFFTIPPPPKAKGDGARYRPNPWDIGFYVAFVLVNGERYLVTYRLEGEMWFMYKAIHYAKQPNHFYSLVTNDVMTGQINRLHRTNLREAEKAFDRWAQHTRHKVGGKA